MELETQVAEPKGRRIKEIILVELFKFSPAQAARNRAWIQSTDEKFEQDISVDPTDEAERFLDELGREMYIYCSSPIDIDAASPIGPRAKLGSPYLGPIGWTVPSRVEGGMSKPFLIYQDAKELECFADLPDPFTDATGSDNKENEYDENADDEDAGDPVIQDNIVVDAQSIVDLAQSSRLLIHALPHHSQFDDHPELEFSVGIGETATPSPVRSRRQQSHSIVATRLSETSTSGEGVLADNSEFGTRRPRASDFF